jgi:hypothetical protein
MIDFKDSSLEDVHQAVADFRYSETEWEAVLRTLFPHDGVGEDHCAAALREALLQVLGLKARLETEASLPQKLRELDEFIASIESVHRGLSWKGINAWPFADFEFENKDLLMDRLGFVLAKAKRDSQKLHDLPRFPPRHSYELSTFWFEALQLWLDLGRDITQSRQLLSFLIASAAPIFGLNVATLDAARRFVRQYGQQVNEAHTRAELKAVAD